MTIVNATWIDESLVEKILRIADKDDSIKVSNLKLKAATAPGDNYTSVIHRVTVTISKVQEGLEVSDEISLIFKIAHESAAMEELITETGLFLTEMKTMSDIFPKMNEILKPLRTRLSARCYYCSTEKPNYLVLEDLARKGFRMADRQKGLDLEHSLIAIRNLAKFHASSVALKEKEPNIFAPYYKPIYHQDHPPSIAGYFTQAVRSLVHESSKWPELNPGISKKMTNLIDVIYQKGCKAAEFDEDSFNVLTHGDCWVNNMLFCYDEDGNVCDQIFVDFQICAYGSVAIDVLYFLATSPSMNVRDNYRELLIREYYVTLTEAMTFFKCATKVPTFDKIQEELNKRCWLGIIPTFSILPTILIDKSDVKSIEEMLGKDNGIVDNPGIRTEQFRKIMLKVLQNIDSQGLLD